MTVFHCSFCSTRTFQLWNQVKCTFLNRLFSFGFISLEMQISFQIVNEKRLRNNLSKTASKLIVRNLRNMSLSKSCVFYYFIPTKTNSHRIKLQKRPEFLWMIVSQIYNAVVIIVSKKQMFILNFLQYVFLTIKRKVRKFRKWQQSSNTGCLFFSWGKPVIISLKSIHL